MNRAILIAIATFAGLILLNLTVFGYLSFAILSEKMVTEKLFSALNEAQVVLRQEQQRQFQSGRFGDSTFIMRKLALRLSSYEIIQAVLLVDEQGRVVGRREVRGRLTAWSLTDRVPPPLNADTPSDMDRLDREPDLETDLIPTTQPGPNRAQQPGSMPNLNDEKLPFNTAGIVPGWNYDDLEPVLFDRGLSSRAQPTGDGQGTRLAIEYNAEALQREVDSLRTELNRKLLIAIGLSVLLLAAAMAYVLTAYKRNQALRAKSAEADRLAYLGTLASGLAHEIRNPLNAMNMNVQLIQEELEETPGVHMAGIGDMLEGTRTEVRRLESMVSAFLSYSRPPNLVRQTSQINDLVTRSLKFLQPEIQARGVQLQTELATNLPEIAVDESQLRQALINIVQNGLHVSEKGQTLTVSTRRAGGDKLLISVQDQGPGISQAEQKNIFKVFYSTKKGGTGLGLATAMRIVESHHGGIKVDSEVGKGTTFTFVLPIDNLESS